MPVEVVPLENDVWLVPLSSQPGKYARLAKNLDGEYWFVSRDSLRIVVPHFNKAVDLASRLGASSGDLKELLPKG